MDKELSISYLDFDHVWLKEYRSNLVRICKSDVNFYERWFPCLYLNATYGVILVLNTIVRFNLYSKQFLDDFSIVSIFFSLLKILEWLRCHYKLRKSNSHNTGLVYIDYFRIKGSFVWFIFCLLRRWPRAHSKINTLLRLGVDLVA